MTTFETTAATIKWVALIVNFKFYRMTYSYLFRKNNFLVLYQKKKFKKHTIVISMISIFFVELINIVACILGFT
jgi:hypothetical protein